MSDTEQNTNRESHLYKEHTITLTPSWRFKVTGPEFNSNEHKSYRHITREDSLAAAREEIDKRLNAVAINEARKFTAVVLSQDAIVTTIRGISRRNGNTLGIEGHRMYPNVTWIKQTILAARELYRQARELDERLSPYKLDVSRYYGTRTPDLMAKELDKLDRELREKTEKAKAVVSISGSTLATDNTTTNETA